MPEIFGKQVSKGTVWAGIGGTAILGVGYYRYRKGQQAAAATAAANAAAQAPGTGAGASDQIDPATGFPYGSTEDAAALTAQAGYNSPIGGLGYSNVGGGYIYGSPGSAMPGGFSSNAQWAQAAEAFLTGQGAPSADVGNALGKYITGGIVSSSDLTSQSYINQAIAFEGYPPVPGPNGFPPSIQMGPVVGNNPPPVTQPPQTATVPNVDGMTGADGYRVLREHSLNPEPGGVSSSRIIDHTRPLAGTSVAKHTTVNVFFKAPTEHNHR